MQVLKAFGLMLSFAFGGAGLAAQAADNVSSTSGKQIVQIQQVRNATVKINFAGKTFLVDPFLAKKGTYPGFEGTFHSELRNPLVDLPMSADQVMDGVDAVIVTHTHLDHWDGGDHKHIPKASPLFVQHESDAKLIKGQGYTDVRIVAGTTSFEGVQLTKIGGQHGTDEMYGNKPRGEALGEAMGIVLRAPGAKTVYLVGDTVWRHEVDDAFAKFKPDVIIMNTGDARMIGYVGAIIMGKDDVLRAYQAMPSSTIVATHMDAINHMTLSRAGLMEHVKQHGIEDRVRIPEDGETLTF